MIKSINIENFLSFGTNDTVSLNSDTNLLVGINGSGKTNFIKAIKFLKEITVGEGMESLFGKWGGFTNIASYNEEDVTQIKFTYIFDRDAINKVLNGKGFHFENDPIYEITIHKQGIAGDYFLSEYLYIPKTPDKELFELLKTRRGGGSISTSENEKVNLRREVFKETETVLRQISEPNRYLPHHTLKAALEQVWVYDYFNTTSGSLLRQLSPFYAEKNLLPDGRNLTNLLSNHISNNHVRHFEKIIEELHNVNPNYKDITFINQGGGKTLLGLKEQKLYKTIPIDFISDGTIRFLILLSICYNPERGTLICIDEPETGLHPDMINSLSRAIKNATSENTQVIIATHSPMLLNNFELEQLTIFEKDSNNKTFIHKVSEDDFEEWSESFMPGRMWLQGLFGGKRW